MMALTTPQLRALMLCAEGLTPTAAIVENVRIDVLRRLTSAGFIRFRAFAKEPHWKSTKQGAEQLIAASARGQP